MELFNADKIRVFKCANCHEFINTSMSVCSFCQAPVSEAGAEDAADLQDLAVRACREAKQLRLLAYVLPLAYVVSWIPFLNVYTTVALPVLFFASPLVFIYWWMMFRKLETDDPDYEPAKTMTLVSLTIWGATFVILLLVRIAIILYSRNQG